MAQKTIKVKSGDTLSKIAKTTGTTVSAIASANKIKDINKIGVGQSLTIPGSTTSSKISTSSSSKISTPSKTTSTSSYNKTKTPILANPFSGGFFKNLVGGYNTAKKSISSNKGSVLKATALDSIKTSSGGTKSLDISNPAGYDLVKREDLGGNFSNIIKGVSQIKEKIPELLYQTPNVSFSAKSVSADEPTLLSDYNSQNIPLVENSGIEPDVATYGTSSGITSEQYTPAEKTSTPSLVESTTQETTSPELSMSTFSSLSTPSIINSINTANNNLGVKSDTLNNPWIAKDTKGEFQNGELINYANTISKGFTTPEEAMAYFNTPQGMASIKSFTDKGGKVEDIISKVTPVKNGIVGPQTFEEFQGKLNDLDITSKNAVNEYIQSKTSGFSPMTISTKNVPSELKNFVDAQNKQAVLDSQYLNTREKMLYEQAFQDRITAQEERNALQKIADARETAIERKTDIAIKQYKAEMKAEEAEIEQNRLVAKKNLTEFLAQIGALRTDGNAQLGIETLDQKYQAQKSGIRAKYNTLIGNIESEANEKLSELQYNLQRDTLELYKDLNKSDREIRMDIMKMKYDYESEVLKANTSYQDKLSDLKIKYSKDASDLAEKEKEWAVKIMKNGYSAQDAKLIAKDWLSSKTSEKTMDIVSSLGEKENQYKFGKDEQSQLLKAGETSDSIAQLQSDISKYGVETVINDAGVDKQTRKALKTIFGL